MPRYKKKVKRVPDEQVDPAHASEKPAAKVGHQPTFVRPEYKVQKFSSPTWRQAAGSGLLVGLLCSVIGFTAFHFSPAEVISITLAFSLFIVLFGMTLAVQRLEIDGPIVKILNVNSYYRYRQFDVSEVDYARLCLPQGQSGMITFQIYLKPSPNRKWSHVLLAKLEGWNTTKSINCAIFIALTEAIRQKQPGFAVQNLPYGYSGPLARPSS